MWVETSTASVAPCQLKVTTPHRLLVRASAFVGDSGRRHMPEAEDGARGCHKPVTQARPMLESGAKVI